MAAQRREVTVVDRATIAFRRRVGGGIRRIARALGRCQREAADDVNRNGGQAVYKPGSAGGQAAEKRAPTGHKTGMARNGALFTEAARLLGLGWSPEQITGRHKREWSVHRGLRVSHEAIYALPCGES